MRLGYSYQRRNFATNLRATTNASQEIKHLRHQRRNFATNLRAITNASQEIKHLRHQRRNFATNLRATTNAPRYDKQEIKHLPRRWIPLELPDSHMEKYTSWVPWKGPRGFREVKIPITPWPILLPHRRLLPGTGVGGGTVEGEFTNRWDAAGQHLVQNSAVAGSYITGVKTEDDGEKMLVREMNAHPCGGQLFYPSEYGEPFLVLIAPPDLKHDFNISNVRAVYCDGTRGLLLHANVWHQPPYSIKRKRVKMWTKQSAVHASIGVDTVKEHGLWIEVGLRLC